MADLTTKTLSELDTVTTVSDTDHMLIESNGTMKKIAASNIGGGGVYQITETRITSTDRTLDKSYTAILDAFNAGLLPVVTFNNNGILSLKVVNTIGVSNGIYGVEVPDGSGTIWYSSDSATGVLTWKTLA